MFRRLFLRECKTDDSQPDELQDYDEDFKTPNFEEWVNKQIQIGSVMVDAFGEKVDSLRIRPFIPKVENSLPTVETGSAIWKNILDGLAGGFTVAQVQTKYKLTKEQIKELVAHEIK